MNTLTKKEAQPVREPSVEREFLTPEVNIFETKDEYVLEAEMPGVNREGLEITLENNVLTLVGRRPDEPVKAEVVYRESRPADFRRSFELDPVVETEKISARMEEGVLLLRLPKTVQAKPRRITVTD
jgi:HSP20 family protein